MALHFLLDDPDLPALDAGGRITLTGAEAHHAAVVRRVRVGEEVTVGDGRGAWGRGEVVHVEPKHVEIVLREVSHEAPATPRIVLVQALAKTDRDELAVQAATELGVDEIIPWQAARSVSRWDATKAVKGVARWQSIVREAAKQSHRAWVPRVSAPLSTAGLVARGGALVVLEPTGAEPLSTQRWEAADTEILLVVGPEGGISEDELRLFADVGARIVRLGDTVLRTSTAGPAALAVLSTSLGRW